jgi:hypothetical protein
MLWTCLPSSAPRNGRKFVSLCGNYVTERDLAAAGQQPTCPDCQNELRRLNDPRTAEDVFGDAPTPSAVPRIPKEPFDPCAGYRPKT